MVTEFFANAYIKGNPNAQFSLIEFSDFECPLCQKFTYENTLNDLLAHYE